MQHAGPFQDSVTSDALRLPLIVHVVRQYAPSRGGLEDVVANLSTNLLENGYRVRVVTLDRLFREPEKTLPAHALAGNVEVVRIPWRGSSRYPLAPQVFRHIQDADLVHVHGVDFFFDALAWLWLLHRKPMVATTHGGFFHTKAFARLKKIWFSTVTRLSASAYRSVICCSQSDLEMFRKIASERAVLIENGVDLTKFSDAASHIAVKRIVTIGRFSTNKRLDRLLDAMVVLVARDPQWHLDIIGGASDWTQADIVNEIRKRKLEGHVDVHVGLENDAIRTLILQASLFASASEYEGFGLVAVEAMSAGLAPVLHSNDAYMALKGRHDALCVADFADPRAAAGAIEATHQRVVDDPLDVRNVMMLAARSHGWGDVTKRHLAVYADALRGRSA